MGEQMVFFDAGAIRLAGLYASSGGALGAVIAHPHPLMGGEMHNPVVKILSQALNACGISTLRFNFRGVGASAGRYDEGRGEQDDFLAAVSFLEEKGLREILPAGYSFGAWVAAGVLNRRTMLPAILVSPPIDLLPFAFPALRGKVGLIACGDRDQFCPADRIRTVAAELSCRLDIFPDTDHFFLSSQEDLAASIAAFMMSLGQQAG
ncbi:MAG: alpha/beta hydrolase [Syntrophales bacterium]